MISLVMQGCSDTNMAQEDISSKNSQIMLTYYSKDTTDGFTSFLQTPRAVVPSRNISVSGDSVEPTDADMFAGLWSSLSEEERMQILSNPDGVSVEISESFNVDEDSSMSRSIAAGNTMELSDSITAGGVGFLVTRYVGWAVPPGSDRA
jgi:hypothetical protein